MKKIAFLAPLIFAVACTDDTIIRTSEKAPSVSVTGEGKVAAIPDVAILTFSVSTRNEEAGAAFNQSVGAMNRVLDAIEGEGVAERDRQTSQVRLNPYYENERRSDGTANRKLTGYEASNSLTVRLRDIDAAGTVIDAAVGAGANGLDSFRLGFDDPKALRDEARIAAVEDAREKAEAMAKAAGVRLGDAINLTTYDNGSPPRPMARMEMADAIRVTGTKIEAGESEIRVTVNATFAIR